MHFKRDQEMKFFLPAIIRIIARIASIDPKMNPNVSTANPERNSVAWKRLACSARSPAAKDIAEMNRMNISPMGSVSEFKRCWSNCQDYSSSTPTRIRAIGMER